MPDHQGHPAPRDAPVTAAFYLPSSMQSPRMTSGGARGSPSGPMSSAPFRSSPHTNLRWRPLRSESTTFSGGSDGLAGAAGRTHYVDAFVFYHYWFDGKRLLEGPVDQFLDSDIDMSFALCWANENWTRRWDGKEREVLIAQHMTATRRTRFFVRFLPYMKDPRYLRRSGALVLLVHRADHLPDPQSFAATWRKLAREEGLGDLWLVASETHNVSPAELGFDAIAEFPPVGDSDLTTSLRRLAGDTEPGFRGRMCSYEALASSTWRECLSSTRRTIGGPPLGQHAQTTQQRHSFPRKYP